MVTKLIRNSDEEVIPLNCPLPSSPTPSVISDTESYRSPVQAISDSSDSDSTSSSPTTPTPARIGGMANLMSMGLIKPVPFSGEKGGTTVTKFLETLELTFMYLEATIPAPQFERAKLLTFQNLLEGKAEQWWNYHATAEQKSSYNRAAAALELRFPVSTTRQSEELGQAMAAFNVLAQNGRSVEEYIEHVSELHSVLGNDFQTLLAMRFIDGITNQNTRQAVDAQVEEPYTLTAVINAYCKSTKSIRRLESYQDKKISPQGAESDTQNKNMPSTMRSATSMAGTGEILRDPFAEVLRSSEKLAAMYIDSYSNLMKKVTEATGGSNAAINTVARVLPAPENRATPAGERYPSGYGSNSSWVPTCVKCGKKGHLSRDCQNPPLSIDEQKKLREKHLKPIQPTQQMIAGVSVIEELTAEELGIMGGDNDSSGTMKLSVSMIEEVYRGQKRTQEDGLGNQGNPLMQIFASMTVEEQRTLLDAVVADKKSRDHIEPRNTQRIIGPPLQKLRTETGTVEARPVAVTNQAPAGHSNPIPTVEVPDRPPSVQAQGWIPPAISQQFTQPQQSQQETIRQQSFQSQQFPSQQYQTQHFQSQGFPQQGQYIPSADSWNQPRQPRPEVIDEDEQMQDESQTQPNWQPFVPDPQYASAEYLKRFLAQNPEFGPAAGKGNKKGKAKARGPKKDKAPVVKKTIRLMSGQKQWDAMEALRNTPVDGLTWGHFLALAPSVKAKLGKGLILEKIPDHPAMAPMTVNMVSTNPEQGNTTQIITRGRDQGFLYGDAIPEPKGPIVNFYTTGRITNQQGGDLTVYQVPKILIDGGAVVNLMPESVVRRLGLPYEANDNVVIRTATNELYPILTRARFNISIADVLAEVVVYVVRQPMEYSLILGRRWMQQVKAFGDYRTHSYVIFDQWNKPHCVQVSPQKEDKVTHERILDVIPNPDKKRENMDLTDTEFEELSMDKEQRDALFNQIIWEARNELEEWDEEISSEEENDEGDTESEEEIIIPRFLPKMTGKGGQC